MNDEIRARAIQALAESRSRHNPDEFLQAWKDGVQLIGPHFFRVAVPSVAAATNKNQLRPDWDVIPQTIGVLSSGQRRFLLAMLQFYNAGAVQDYCAEHQINPPSMVDLALLDRDHLDILVRLLESYAGW